MVALENSGILPCEDLLASASSPRELDAERLLVERGRGGAPPPHLPHAARAHPHQQQQLRLGITLPACSSAAAHRAAPALTFTHHCIRVDHTHYSHPPS